MLLKIDKKKIIIALLITLAAGLLSFLSPKPDNDKRFVKFFDQKVYFISDNKIIMEGIINPKRIFKDDFVYRSRPFYFLTNNFVFTINRFLFMNLLKKITENDNIFTEPYSSSWFENSESDMDLAIAYISSISFTYLIMFAYVLCVLSFASMVVDRKFAQALLVIPFVFNDVVKVFVFMPHFQCFLLFSCLLCLLYFFKEDFLKDINLDKFLLLFFILGVMTLYYSSFLLAVVMLFVAYLFERKRFSFYCLGLLAFAIPLIFWFLFGMGGNLESSTEVSQYRQFVWLFDFFKPDTFIFAANNMAENLKQFFSIFYHVMLKQVLIALPLLLIGLYTIRSNNYKALLKSFLTMLIFFFALGFYQYRLYIGFQMVLWIIITIGLDYLLKLNLKRNLRWAIYSYAGVLVVYHLSIYLFREGPYF